MTPLIKTTLLAATILTVSGCATQPAQYSEPNPHEAQCEYEADAATVNIRNPWEQAWQKGSLKDKCLRAKAAQP